MDPGKTLYFYLHTHWDREWYWNFNAYRTELLHVVRGILSKLEAGELESFLLDGQTSLVEDVLALDAKLAPRIEKLAASGKLSLGPWYVLADQLLVGGESLVRNLALGCADARNLGALSSTGYCPDTFGHSADLPRILRGFGITSAVVWRGVPPLPCGPVFDWRTPGGPGVTALQLNRGYYLTAFHEDLDDEIMSDFLVSFLGEKLAKGERYAGRESALIDTMDGALVPVGGDHLAAPRGFSQRLESLSSRVGARLIPVSLDTFMSNLEAAQKGQAIYSIEGELRDNRAALVNERAYMLDGVLSTRLYLKRDNRLSERRIVRMIEPLYTILAARGVLDYASDELRYAWRLLLQNQPHDSICGCSIDEVHREMKVRTTSFNALLDVLCRRAGEALDGSALHGLGDILLPLADPESRLVVVNHSSREALGPVALSFATVRGGALPSFAADMQIVEKLDRREAFNRLGGVPDFKDVTVYSGFVASGSLAPLSARMHETSTNLPALLEDMGEALPHGMMLQNEYFKLYLQTDGNLTVECAQRQYRLGHRLVDVADVGDTYNFDPIAGDEPLTATVCAVRAGLAGPHVASMIVEYLLDLPLKAEETGAFVSLPGEAEDAQKLPLYRRSKNYRTSHLIQVEIRLERGVPIVFFDARWQNHASDHRLEVVFDLFADIENTVSENHFCLIERPLSKEAKPVEPVALGCEAPLTSLPCQRFFIAGDSIFFNSGLPEYRACKKSVSYTLLRSVSALSRDRLFTRGGGAGPAIATPEANCLGEQHVSYGWSPLALASGDDATRAYALAALYERPLACFVSSGAVAAPLQSPLLRFAPSAELTALYIEDGGLIARFLNLESSPVKLEIEIDETVKGQVSRVEMDLSEVKKLTRRGSLIVLDMLANELATIKIDLEAR